MHESFAPLMKAVAQRLLGEPNKALSHGHELRFGNRGSLSVDTKRGVWHDHESGEGGGVLALISRVRGLTKGQALDWLRAEGFGFYTMGGTDAAPLARLVTAFDTRPEDVRAFAAAAARLAAEAGPDRKSA